MEEARNSIKLLKTQIEQRRAELADEGRESKDDEEEQRLRSLMDQNKQQYTEGYRRLQSLKSDVDRIQKLIAKGLRQLESDFDSW